MSYYRTCPHCGDNLDPGEVCRCPATSSQHEKARTAYNFLIDYEEEGKDLHTAVQVVPEPIMESVTTPETATAYLLTQYALHRKLITAVIHVPGVYELAELVDIQEQRRTLPSGSRFTYLDIDERGRIKEEAVR